MTIRRHYAVSLLAVGLAGVAQHALAVSTSAVDPVDGLTNITPIALGIFVGIVALVCGVRAGGAYLHERPLGPPVAQGIAAIGTALGGAAAVLHWTSG